jgi:cytochrome c oxidase subunit II
MSAPIASRPWVLEPASMQAGLLAEVSWTLILGASVVFMLTMAALAWSLKRRSRPAVPDAVWIWGAGVAFPAAVLVALFVYALWRTHSLQALPAARPLVIGVTAHRYWWEVRVHDEDSGQPVVLANEIHLPAGRPVQLGLESADVIHTVWVPTLGGKMDTVPGRVTRLMLTATTPGVHRGQCAEYCGTQHARMVLHVVVHPRAAYKAWVGREREPAAPPPTPLALQGRQAFLAHGCATCHTVRGVATGTLPGPDLTHVAARLTLGAGTLRNGPGAFAAWITGVQSLKEGAHMPSFRHLDGASVQALSAYLASLQ